MPDRMALIIANSEFNDPRLGRLKTPVRDAEVLAEVLHNPDIGAFDVALLVDEPESVVRRKIARLYAQRRKSDLLLLYYSGHGIRDAHGDLYLATRDTEMDLVGATALDAAYVRAQIDKSGSQRKVVVLDCCHSGAFAKAGLGDSVGTEDAFTGSGYGRVILTASDALELSWEGDEWLGEGQPSVFTHFLVEGLRTGAADLNGDGKIVLDELYDYVYERVLTSGHARQTPHKWVQKVHGQIVIAHSRRPILPLTGLPPDLQRAIESPVGWMREGAVSGLERLMLGGEGAVTGAARAALEQLTHDENPRVAAAVARVLGIEAKSHMPAPKVPPTIEKLDTPIASTPRQPLEPEMILIPAGEFLMGSDPKQDKDADGDEQPQHTLNLPDYYLAKTPVTNAQYLAFVQATGHRQPRHWERGKPPGAKAEHPVVNVSWADAVTYCRWLAEASGKPYRLPSEAEWEKGARGAGGRIWPWGNRWDPKRCNSKEGGKGGTTPVGAYPQGASPYGCLDMAGNVWEWTSSLWGKDSRRPDFKYPYDAADGREDPEAEGRRVLRGGAFGGVQWLTRCAYRVWYFPFYSNVGWGFRVVVAPGSTSGPLASGASAL